MRQIGITRVFERIHESDKPVLICRGGARSSKSHSVAQYLIEQMTQVPNCKILICRKTMPALKLTAYKLFVDLLKEYDRYRFCEHNKTNNYITYLPNNAFIAFLSVDDPEKIKSSEWNFIWMEEASEFSYNDYMTLKLRLSAKTETKNKMLLSFNPVDAFCYIKTQIIDKDNDYEELVSNYKDNPYLSQDYVELLLSTKDPYYRKVYVDGEWGVLKNLIFPTWQSVDVIPPAEKTIYGLDFGYNDPTALVEIRFREEGVYIKQLLYATEMTNTDLIEWSLTNININTTMYSDSAEPQRIEELRRAGINAKPTKKGPDSVRKSIDTVRAQNLFISSDSIDLIKEIRAYRWDEDKSGKPLNQPAEGFDHLVSAMRYGIHEYLTRYRDYKLIIGE
jgi:phage terminase large subunit